MSNSVLFFYVTIVLQILMVSTTVYLFAISLAGWTKRGKDKAEKSHPPTKTFAMVVAAHNEEAVVPHIVKSFLNMDYPREMYDIFVIADNCNDKTAEAARNAGAEVLERFNTEKKGKGYALQWAFDIIFKKEKEYDAVVVFDADNLVTKNFLNRFNDMMCEGHQVIQAYLDMKNPYDSWVTLSYSIMYWVTNRLFNQSRHNLNMWSTIGGTGFAVSTEVLKRIPWDATCLTEDLEYTVKLVLQDVRVSWCADAAIFDEKPITFKQSWNQRKRWMQGHVDVFTRYFPSLLKKGLKERKLTALDLALYNFQPINIVAQFFISIAVSIAAYALGFFDGGFHSLSVQEVINQQLLPNWLLYTILGVLNILPMIYLWVLPAAVLISEKRFNFKVLLGLFILPIYALSWIPIIIYGILNKNKKEWNHTVHTRQISINELEEA